MREAVSGEMHFADPATADQRAIAHTFAAPSSEKLLLSLTNTMSDRRHFRRMEIVSMSDLKYRRPKILDRIPLDQHALIEASAGTARPTLSKNLVVEILLKTDATIDKILVVTFTEKATSELRARIRATLESVITGASAKDADDKDISEIGEDGIADSERRCLV